MEGKGFNTADRLDRDWRTMILIAHDFFHCWRQAVCEKYGESQMEELTLRFWDLVGKNTAAQYSKGKIDPLDLERVAMGAARSSEIMGETVKVRNEGDAWLLIHDACPWIESYKRAGFEGKCRPGCDRWFAETVRTLSPRLGVDTLACLGDGDDQCVRKFYLKE